MQQTVFLLAGDFTKQSRIQDGKRVIIHSQEKERSIGGVIVAQDSIARGVP